jgi:hypothetical protein
MRTCMAKYPMIAWLLAAASQGTAADRLKVDEPGFQISLSAQTAGTTPGCAAGFYALRVGDGAEPGNVPGFYSSELLLQAPGSRVFAGGFNFGGLADSSVPAFAAINIANAANEPQTLRVSLSGTRPGSAASLRVELRLRSRAPSPERVIYAQTLTLQPGVPVARSDALDPGFYAFEVLPLDAVAGADAQLSIGLETSFVGRPGGGFQGGVNFGGYHDPAAAPVSGFAGFCLADAHGVNVRTYGRASFPGVGAGDLRVQLVRDNSQAAGDVLYDSNPSAPSTVQGTLRIVNTLDTRLYAPRLNQVAWADVAPRQSIDLSYQGPARGRLEFHVATNPFTQATRVIRSEEIVFTANGQVQIASVAHNNVAVETVTGAEKALAPVALYSAVVDQGNPAAVQARFFNGLTGQEDAVAIPGLAGPVTLRNNTLPGNPRVYFVVNPTQSARVRAVQNGTNLVATILQQSYADLAAAPSGDSVAPITPETFGPTTSFCPQPVLTVPGCVGSATQFAQVLTMSSAGRSDNLQFTLCSNYATTNPNSLRVSRSGIICTLPSPAQCPGNSGLSISVTNASGTLLAGPSPVPNGGSTTLTLAGPGWSPGASYCLSARQVNPWEGPFSYEFRLLGTPQL